MSHKYHPYPDSFSLEAVTVVGRGLLARNFDADWRNAVWTVAGYGLKQFDGDKPLVSFGAPGGATLPFTDDEVRQLRSLNADTVMPSFAAGPNEAFPVWIIPIAIQVIKWVLERWVK